MHRVIFLVLPGYDEEGADVDVSVVEEAQNIFRQHLRYDAPEAINGTLYDYCTPMEGGHGVTGSDRWTGFDDTSLAVPLDDERAQGWIEDALEYPRDEFAANFARFIRRWAEVVEERGGDANYQLTQLVSECVDLGSYPGADRAEFQTIILDQFEDVLDTGYGASMARYSAGHLDSRHPMVAQVFNCVESDCEPVDTSDAEDRIRGYLDDPDGLWVVPLDVHS